MPSDAPGPAAGDTVDSDVEDPSSPDASANRYCPTCGNALGVRRVEGRERPYCDSCERPVYRNPKPAAGVVVVDGEEVLLVRRTQPPAAGSWSLPAGYLEHDEPPRDGAVRELREETGVTVTADSLSLLDTTFVDHGESPSVLVVVYAVPRAATAGDPFAGSDAGAARFWALDELAAADASLEPGYRGVFQRAILSLRGGYDPPDVDR